MPAISNLQLTLSRGHQSFRNAERRANNSEYWTSEGFHFCVLDHDVEGLAAKIGPRAAGRG